MKVSGSDRNKAFWGVVDDNVFEEPKENDKIGLHFFK